MEYAADFETNTSEDGCAANPVWAWGCAVVGSGESTYVQGDSIAGFLDFAFSNPGRYWFHNAGFDSKFIIHALMTSGYSHSKARHPDKREFTTLISDTGRFYHMECMDDAGSAFEVADSYNKLPMTLAKVAGAYGLPMTKGEIDYGVYREPGHVLTAEESDYLRRDVLILAEALSHRFAMGDRLTTGSDCLCVARDMFGQHNWRKLFPALPLELDDALRRGYRGGYVYVNPNYAEKRVGRGGVIDVNSLYPYTMRDRPLPWGKPVERRGKPSPTPRYPLWVAEVVFTFALKPGMLPCIQVKGDPRFNAREYQTSVGEPVSQVFTSVDWALINDCYEVDVVEWGRVWYFRSSEQMFDTYVDQGMAGKINARSAGERQNYKLWLNNLYGKYAQKLRVRSKVPVLHEDNVVRYVNADPEEREGVYLPVGMFITAWARDYTIRTATEFGDRFLYSDTDSIHFLGEEIPPCVRIDAKALGAWDLEAVFEEAVFLRAKTYAERVGGEWRYTCAGMVDGLKAVMDIEDFRFGFTTDLKINPGVPARYTQESACKLVPRNVEGGVILERRPFTLRR